MAHDLESSQDVALKVLRLGIGDIEAQKQDIIRQLVDDTSHLVVYLQRFQITTELGSHHVLVLPLKGPTLMTLSVPEDYQIPMATRMSAAKQLLVALGNLHKADIVHRGMAPTGHLPRSEKYKIFGRPLRQALEHLETSERGEMVDAMEIPLDRRADEIFLGDFSLAMRIGDDSFPNQVGFPPDPWLSPERYHGFGPSFACDMWSYMAIFGALYIGETFFSYALPRGTGGGGPMICTHYRHFGPLPKEWKGLHQDLLGRGDDGKYNWCYDQRLRPNPKAMLDAKLRDSCPDADPAELELVHRIMLKVFRYRPAERLNAFQLLHDPDFVALMARYGC
ncbi:kinase-like domain-containing protein [Aspergillus karnatakaensis]|uniref:kinase-like domain-containing protein n=1 Tax=Aspergillus karnatakaensis TaxID=1810916 RepID=UPI003CCDC2B9